MRSRHYYIRKSHRYLGLLLAIQFLLWTISGLYFSWTNLDEIHGDFQRRQPKKLSANINMVSPAQVLQQLADADSVHSLQLVSILQKPYYDIIVYKNDVRISILADAQNGNIRDRITKEEAISIAAESFNGQPKLKKTEYLTSTDGHHEYREKPLPAWAVTFQHPSNTTIYVSADHGKVESFRNDKWRLFDFLWMGHTMDYKSRDDINNWLLRIFSAFGLITVLSGLFLFFVSTKLFRRKRK